MEGDFIVFPNKYFYTFIEAISTVDVVGIEILSKHLTQSQWGKIQTEAQKGEGLNPLLTLSNTLVRNLVVTNFTLPRLLVMIFSADKSLH